MEYRELGDSGLSVSAVGLGGNSFGQRLDDAQTNSVVSAALDAGVTFIDTADVYGGIGGSETAVGRALLGRRDRAVLATKFGHPSVSSEEHPGSRLNVRRSVEASLERLQTDYIDLYYLHVPDPSTPLVETLTAMTELVVEGKVLHLGACNFSAEQLAEAQLIATGSTERFIACQNRYSLLDTEVEDGFLDACAEAAVGFVAYTPLAMGLLTGRFRRDEPVPEGTRLAQRLDTLSEKRFDQVQRLESYAKERQLSMLEVAIGGLLARPAVTSVLVGASTAEQVHLNAAASAWVPSAEDLKALHELRE